MKEYLLKENETIDNGGAVAINGFNYQAAVIMLIALLNYKKRDFSLFIETKDDVEVSLERTHTFAQIKSLKNLSITALVRKNNKNQKSILSKNLSSTAPNARYKIITPYFSDNDMSKIVLSDEHIIFDEGTYCYTEAVKKEIANKIKEYAPDIDDIYTKLNHSFISITAFKDDLKAAYYYLLGRMVGKDLCTQNRRGELALQELFFLISDISSKKIYHPTDREKKVITSDKLKEIFREANVLEYEDALFSVLSANGFNALDIMRIKREKANIPHLYVLEKKIIKQILGEFNTNEKSDIEALEYLYNKVQQASSPVLANISKNAIYAILIELYADKEKEKLE